MKGLASVLGILLFSAAALAGPLEASISGGPATASLDDINTAILVFNTLITHLNETLAVIPNVHGTVDTLAPMISGLTLRASEGYRIADWIALTGAFEYYHVSTATKGQYVGAETSTIDVSAALTDLAFLAGARIQFLDAGLRLAGDIQAGYFYATVDHSVVFQIPSEYPGTISGVPPDGSGRNSGGGLGVEVGLSMTYPIIGGFSVNALVSYRWATVPTLHDASGNTLDLDGNGKEESVSLDGMSVQVGFSLALDLSPTGEKGE